METRAENMYQLKQALVELNNNSITKKVAETFIVNVTCAFAEEKYFKDPQKNEYYYTEDFTQLVLVLAKLDRSYPSVHTWLLQCERRSISYSDMEHFFYLLLLYKSNFSEKLTIRIYDVLQILHFIKYNKKNLTFTTDEKIIKKKLLFYIVAKENNEMIKITSTLTISQFFKTVSGNKSCEI